MKYQLTFRVEAGQIVFQLTSRPLLAKPQAVPVSDWAARATGDLLRPITYLLGMAEDEPSGVTNDADSVSVPHTQIAAITDALARDLGLPPPVPFILDLQHSGRIDEVGFCFRVQWRDAGQRVVIGTQRVGSILTVGDRTYRIPDPQFTLVESADAFNSAPAESRDSRLAFWARMRELLPEETRHSIQVTGYLRETRIVHATRFSLALKRAGEGLRLDPILFGNSGSAGDDEPVHEIEGVLPPSQQKLFSEKRFHAQPEARSRYALDAGWYVVLSDDVRRALNVVHAAQRADQATRWAFARNPRAFLRKALENTLTDDQLSNLFVETFEYSQRVQGEGLWQKEVLPWIKKAAEDWLPPEKFGLKIGDRLIQLSATEIPETLAKIEAARKNGEPSVRVGDEIVPATQETIDALQELTQIVKPQPPREGVADTPVGERSRRVLLISTHHDKVEFSRPVQPRPSVIAADVTGLLSTQLKPHQQAGVTWLQRAWTCGLPGVLLADDMGLGKTLQALAFIAWRRADMARQVHRPILVVAPTALLKTWEEEAEKHLSGTGVGELLRAYGSDLRRLRDGARDELALGQSVLDVQRIQRAGWVLTTYEAMRDYQHSLASVQFDTIVFDEVQKIKTPGTLVTHAAKALNGKFIVGLSGTPVENRLADLWCVVDAACPGALGDLKNFSETYEADPSPDKLRTLKSSLTESRETRAPLMLRRLKSSHLPGLPQKREHVIAETMPPEQASAYSDAIEKARSGVRKGAVLEVLHQIRSISLHPIHPDLADPNYVRHSARFNAMLVALDKIAASGEKALIFLESREMQRYLAVFLQRRYSMRHLPLQINGAVSGPERQNRVNKFQSGPRGFDVMILSPRAGGVGLTLTAANHVIHLSRWWNPAVEDQCSDRVYRIGQPREVHIYYPLAIHPEFGEHSFDMTLHSLLEKKRSLSAELLLPPGGSERDAEELYRATISPQRSSREPAFSITDIDAMEPIQFEEWALGVLRSIGYRVFRTPWSGDWGVDGIAKKPGHRDILIQCKHSQVGAAIPPQAVSRLLEARTAYGVSNPMLVVITNSSRFARETERLALAHSVRLVAREELDRWPRLVSDAARA